MSEKITFKELVELIAKQSKQSESSANSFIHELVQIIEGGLKNSGSVSISGFGKFELRWMKERSGVNPQTGDEITIPGQNKVVFKPYKALRETVNKPFANLEPEILTEKSGTEESSKEEDSESEGSDDPFGLDEIFGTDAPQDSDFGADDSIKSNDPFDSDSDVDYDSEDPFGFEKKAKASSLSQDYNKYIDDLIYEKENPHFGKSEPRAAAKENDEDGDLLVMEREKKEEDGEELPKVAPSIPDESKMARKVQESGSFKWSYAAAVIIVMVALILLFWMMQRSGDSLEETASTTNPGTQNQTEQVLEPSTSESEAESTADTETAGEQQSESNVDEESPPTSGEAQTTGELETQSFTVESGQSLWDIAENQLGNPYLWPVIYYLNQDILSNPNQLLANSDIDIPTFSDPDNLSEFEREQVALGYFSLYQWNQENNPDEARYFLWAVGVFSQDLLDQPPSDVDPEDLAFARNR
ncbi:HU family DNA-binding protein [Rhodohalobacter sulfatireducens]|uniref:HU family DNA-binding protein n=1 Tax=Rhodohalobacter sulfatireducens TaxID=2911366 RepID=A0ABS9KBS0_9BACT|nr:HU family DNA-binding protein [Rhodohalobacter sulfatireducens]MCG2588263.1 HU family DNA-binding protein [Rhodohalobacter sulfatireducens]